MKKYKKSLYKNTPYTKEEIDMVCEFAKTEHKANLIFYTATRMAVSPREIIKFLIRYQA